MEKFEITEAELNRLAYIDEAIKNTKTQKQKEAIEIEEKKRLQKLQTENIKKIKEKKTPYRKWSLKWNKYEDEMTEEEIEKDVEYGFRKNYN